MIDPKRAYAHQKRDAKARGIAWELTYDERVKWWGDDIGKRGCGHDRLSMQRVADSGPYALGNIRKGYPRDNVKTKGILQRNKTALCAADFLEAIKLSLPSKIDHGPHDDTKLSEDERFYANMGKVRSSLEIWSK